MNSYFLYRAPSPTCYPHGGHWGPPWEVPPTTFILHLTTLYTLHNLTTGSTYTGSGERSLKFAKFWPLGPSLWAPHRSHMYHMNNFESPAPKDDSCHVWLKSNHAFSKRRWNSYFLQRAHRSPLGPPWELPWTTFVLHLTRYLHTT